MNMVEIKAAVDAGQIVHWANEGYVVHKDHLGQYLITYLSNGSTIGLTNRQGTRLNGISSFPVRAPHRRLKTGMGPILSGRVIFRTTGQADGAA